MVKFLPGVLFSAASRKVMPSPWRQSTGWLVNAGVQSSGPFTSIWGDSERPSQHQSFLRDWLRPPLQLHHSSTSPSAQSCPALLCGLCSPEHSP